MSIPSDIIPDGTTIENVDVLTQFEHTYVADLQAFLWHSDQTVVLFGDDNGDGQCNADNVHVMLSDSSPNAPYETGTSCDSGSYGIGGSHRPVDPLSVYNGLEANGDWHFFVHDQESSDSGTFGSWAIQLTLDESFCTPSPTPTPTGSPTKDPTPEPTRGPTADPTAAPSADPTAEPTADPTVEPTVDPTVEPTADPTGDPTTDPSADPTMAPSADPTKAPTGDPTMTPTAVPTAVELKADGDDTANDDEGEIVVDEPAVTDADGAGAGNFEDNDDGLEAEIVTFGLSMNMLIVLGIIALCCCVGILCVILVRSQRKKKELMSPRGATDLETTAHVHAGEGLRGDTGHGLHEMHDLQRVTSMSTLAMSPTASPGILEKIEVDKGSDSEDLSGLWTGSAVKQHRKDLMVTPVGPGSIGKNMTMVQQELEQEEALCLEDAKAEHVTVGMAEDEDGDDTDDEQEDYNRMYSVPMGPNVTAGH